MLIKISLLYGLIFLLAIDLNGQDSSDVSDADELFRIARGKVFDGKRHEGQKLLHQILKSSPSYDDVRIFLARTYSWDKEFDTARMELEIVLSRTPDQQEAIHALVDVEAWDDNPEQALVIVNKGLGYYPDDPDLLYQKARILSNLNRSEEALAAVEKLLIIEPGDKRGVSLANTIRSARRKYTAGVWYGFDLFSHTFDPATYSAVQLARANCWGTSIFRLNYASRFSSHGFQPEVDVYPKIAKGVYAYLNYGYSKSSLFSRHRAGAEVYASLPGSIEVSTGLRYLYFAPASNVVIYTGSLGWYFKSYWISFRPYVTPDRSGTSFSSTFVLRKYFSDSDSYLGLNAGFGFSPDERKIQTGAGLTPDGIYILKSQNAGITWQKKFRNDFIVNVSYSLLHQELSFDLGRYVWISSSLIGIKKKF